MSTDPYPPVEGSAPTPAGERRLERSYRRLLRAFPSEYLAEREEELIGVLLAGAEPGRTRASAAEAVDLVQAGLVARARRGRRWLATDSWAEAGRVLGVVLAVLLAAIGTRYVVQPVNILRSGAEVFPWVWDDVRAGWYVPAIWLAVVLALVLGWTRLAAVASWVAVVARATAVVALLQGPLGRPPWVVQPVVPQLMVGLVAALLLSNPTLVRSTLASLGRRRLVLAAAVAVAANAVGVVANNGRGTEGWAVLVGLAALAWWAVGPRGSDRSRAAMVLARVGAGVLVVIVGYVLSRAWVSSTGAAVVTRRDLVVTLVVGIVLVGGGLAALVALEAVLRRVPYRVVRRD